MVWRPALRDLENEREVVLEEIAMYDDDPQDKVFDVLGHAVFGDHPLGRAIIGTRRGRSPSSTATGCPRSTRAHYHPPQVVIAAAGSVDHDRIVEMVLPARTERRAARAPAADRARPFSAQPSSPARTPSRCMSAWRARHLA